MVAPWQETQFRVVVEFKKGGSGVHREIKLTNTASILPSQLYARVSPEVWAVFMTDIGQLALGHPYLHPPTAKQGINWLGGALCALIIGFGCFEGDAGEYGPWLQQLEQALERHRPAFAAGGAALGVGRVHGSYWVQVDVDPRAMAVGAPVPMGVPYTYAAPLPYGAVPPGKM